MRQRRPALTLTIAVLAALASAAAPAPAATGGASPAAEAPPPAPTPSAPAEVETPPDPGTSPRGGAISLTAARVWPRRAYFDGLVAPRLRFEIAGPGPATDLRIDLLGPDGEVVRSFRREGVASGEPAVVRWDGRTRERRPAPPDRYSFRLAPVGVTSAARRAFMLSARRLARRGATSSSGPGPASLGFSLHGFAFPLPGAHDFGGAESRFGGGRSGHTHQGQDMSAACGTPVLAARGGRVRYAGFQSAAGNYLVIDGRGTGLDTVYMHLLRPTTLRAGQRVRTGQEIGLVGSTGSSTGCHLHFELWTAPGWYEGGRPIDPLAFLRRWDRYS